MFNILPTGLNGVAENRGLQITSGPVLSGPDAGFAVNSLIAGFDGPANKPLPSAF